MGTSVQFAVYPGDGRSGYLRHCDRGEDACRSEQTKETAESPERIITAIYYLTDDDWDPILDGGCLRLFSSSSSSSSCHYHDVCPYRDRLIVFRSDGVEHQVMPSKRRSRAAITIWFYGKLIHTAKEERTNSSYAIILSCSSCAILVVSLITAGFYSMCRIIGYGPIGGQGPTISK